MQSAASANRRIGREGSVMSRQTRRRQFHGTRGRRAFFDRKVRREGHARVLSLSKVIPEDWLYVRITPLNRTENTVELLIEKLYGEKKDESRSGKV